MAEQHATQLETQNATSTRTPQNIATSKPKNTRPNHTRPNHETTPQIPKPPVEIAKDEIASAEVASAEVENTEPKSAEEAHPDARVAQLFLEDLVITALLRLGRAISHTELNAAADGISLGRAALRRGLAGSERITIEGRDYEMTLRLRANAQSRQERARRPLEATLDELLHSVGKPLPLPVIARETANSRGVLLEGMRESCAHILQTSRAATPTAPNTWIHSDFLLDSGAPNEKVLIRENKLESDADFAQLSQIEYSNSGATPNATLSERAVAILEKAARPVSQKLLGFLLQRQDNSGFSARELAQTLGDRVMFYSFVGGFVTTQAQMPNLRSRTQNWLGSEGGAAVDVDFVALLRTRISPEQIVVPGAAELEEITKMARSAKASVSVVSILTDLLEIEPDDAAFVGTLQGITEALRRDSAWLPAGAGRFLLRELVPKNIGQTPENLRPIHLPIRDNETNEPLDIEMSDDGLEGDCVEFIHDAQWEDVGEEVEVKMARRAAADAISSTRYVVTYPHHRDGTIKLRRMDEEFFALGGALSRVAVRASDDEGNQEVVGWASRESGLIYGFGDWFGSRTPQSGAVLEFSRDANSRLQLKLGAPDKLMTLSEARLEELESLQERSSYVSLFDLLQTLLGAHEGGAELQTLWAEINVVRRTSKRLMCSVLSAYQRFSFKQRGPKQILWRFDSSKTELGFKKNKRKFVRR